VVLAKCSPNVEFPAGRLSAVEVEVLRRNEKNNQVASNESSEDAQVSPPVAKLVTEGFVKLVANLVGAVVADIGCVIEEVSRRTAGEEIAHVCSTVLTLWGAELIVLAGCAFDREVVEFGNDHAANEACERVKLVKPHTPELGNLGLGNGDTAEKGEDDLEKELVHA
jgi:hypothetical protein